MDQRRSKSEVARKSRTPLRRVASKIYPNPFLNFLKDLRKSNKHKLGLTELTRRGGQLWRSMSARERSPYINISKQAPRFKTAKRRRRRSRRRGRRRRSGGRRRRRSRSSSYAEDSVERQSQKQQKKRERAKKDQKNEEKSKSERTNRNEREEQKGNHKCGECDRREEDGDLRLKSADYDDIRRDYI